MRKTNIDFLTRLTCSVAYVGRQNKYTTQIVIGHACTHIFVLTQRSFYRIDNYPSWPKKEPPFDVLAHRYSKLYIAIMYEC